MNSERTYHDWVSYRRLMLDSLQEQFNHLYHGHVLDIGGRDRGRFQKPKGKVKKWIFADINDEYKPDIILDVTNMKQITSNSIDVINAIELFEHVINVEKAISECYRVLKENGILIISVPFLSPIHADPYDFQRWTDYKWKIELGECGFSIQKFIIMGRFYTSLAEMIIIKLKDYKAKSVIGKLLYYVFRPFVDRSIKLDNKPSVKDNPKLSKYHSGYFIIAKKKKIV
ncbi:unnamed protein product [marine sediment metagenome]|uniref:Methyltransferase type 11 domain-containing protein n=1 Tax=marine sediment metagenome TaxID=412755 RepID=X1B1D9_9ZZZZ